MVTWKARFKIFSNETFVLILVLNLINVYPFTFCKIFCLADSVEATSDPVDQDLALKASSDTSTVSHPFKIGQMDVELGGSVNLQCPQGKYKFIYVERIIKFCNVKYLNIF